MSIWRRRARFLRRCRGFSARRCGGSGRISLRSRLRSTRRLASGARTGWSAGTANGLPRIWPRRAMGCLLSAALREARRRSLRVTGILRAGLRRLAWRLSRSAFRSGAPGQWSCRTERALSWAAIKKEKGEAMQARLRRAAMVSSSAAGVSPLPGRQSPRNGERRFKGSICAIRMDLPFCAQVLGHRKDRGYLLMKQDGTDLLVALDIGTSKVAVMVAEQRGEGGYEVIGVGQSDSNGLKKGVVINIGA